MSISSKPISGMRDLLPEQLIKRKYVIQKIEAIYKNYGFQPLETPSVEKLAVLSGKYGSENDQLIFKLLHRGDKLARVLEKTSITESDLTELGLRFDLTVPLARVVAEYGRQLPKYFKRYQIQPVWRADRPAKGRFREFYQCDIDTVGVASVIAEIEILSAIASVLNQLNLSNCQIHINHRQLLRALIHQAGIKAEQESTALIALDKIDKIGEDGVKNELIERGISAEASDKLLTLTASNKIFEHSLDHLEYLSQNISDNQGLQAIAELQSLFNKAQSTKAGTMLHFSPRLARGLGYYTGAIFEITHPELSISLGGGGRYDKLVGMFGKQDIPAVGFSLGLERILLLMEEHNLFPEHLNTLDAMVCPLSEAALPQAIAIADILRAANISVNVYPETQKLNKQLKYANDMNTQHAIMIGEDELKNNSYTVKNLHTGEQQTVDEQQLLTLLRK